LTPKSSLAFIALDNWLMEAARKSGEPGLDEVIKAFRNDLRFNVTYYRGIAEQFRAANETVLASKYDLLARIYQGLLESA